MRWSTSKRAKVLAVFVQILLVAVFCGHSLAGELYPQAVSKSQLEISKQLEGGAASSASIAIAEGNNIVYTESFGLRDRAQNLPVNIHTQFNVGSVTKIFTAAALLLLCEEGKLNLDEPVITYLPEFTLQDERYKKITVRMLVNHTSGLPGTNYRDGFTTAPNREYVAETLELFTESTLKHDPGAISVYCNDGFTVAEALIEKISGVSFAEYLQKKVFDPLGMNDTSLNYGRKNVAYFYNNVRSAPYPLEYVNVLASGGISSTAADLVRFGRAIYEGTLLSVDSSHEFTISQIGPNTVLEGQPVYNFGLGWDDVSVESFSNQDVTVLSKIGGTLMYSSQLLVAPEHKVAVALTFSGPVDTHPVATAIMQTLLAEKGVLTPQTETPNLTQPATMPKELSSFEGYYGTSNSVAKVEFDWEANALNYWVFGGSEFLLQEVMPYHNDGAFHTRLQSRVRFAERDGDQVITTQRPGQEGRTVVGERIWPQAKPIDGQAFAKKVWIPRSFSPIDFVPSMTVFPETGLLPDLPGYIYVLAGFPGDFTPCELVDPLRAGFSLKYKRDQVEPILAWHHGELLLYLGRYVYSNAAEVADLASGEIISIDARGMNECRRISTDAIFHCLVPDGCRVIVYSPVHEVICDSLLDDTDPLPIEGGSYVLFIGSPGAVFEPELR